jgi:hypothetical protein
MRQMPIDLIGSDIEYYTRGKIETNHTVGGQDKVVGTASYAIVVNLGLCQNSCTGRWLSLTDAHNLST